MLLFLPGDEQKKVEKFPDITYQAPLEYNSHLDHHINFFESIKTGKPVVEDAVFGFRAAGPCLACNDSYFNRKVINWDPEQMKITL